MVPGITVNSNAMLFINKDTMWWLLSYEGVQKIRKNFGFLSYNAGWMKGSLGSALPERELRQLDFLIGDSSGPGVLYPPGRVPVEFTGHLHVEREECERFLRIEFFGKVPMLGDESIHSLVTYSRKHECFQMWSFASSQEQPMLLRGHFEGRRLVFVSDPTEMVWGPQRMRCTFTHLADGVVDYQADLWTIDGYTPYFRATYSQATVNLV